MEQNQDELQKAINNITGASNATDGATDVVSEVTNKVANDLGAPAAPAVPEMPAMPPAASAAPAVESTVQADPTAALYGNEDLGKIKTMALSDLRPILEKIQLSPEKKFAMYRDIIEVTEDKACIEPAYNAAKQIEDEAERAEALVYVVECIDKLGIAVAPAA